MTETTNGANLAEILDDCEGWAKSATVLAKKMFRQDNQLAYKEDESPVTIADQLIEKELKAEILKKYPEFGIFGEESGVDGGLDGDLWVIDPIDGTRSFISGNPLFGMLLAYVHDGKPKAGIISMPILNEIYSGGEGIPAKCNGQEIRVSSRKDLDEAIIYINEGDKLFLERREQAERLLKVGKTRRFGYDCYSHALMAAGHIDAVVDYDLKPYDFLAVSAVVKAAGGVITDWEGKELDLNSDGAVVSSANLHLHEKLLEQLRDKSSS